MSGHLGDRTKYLGCSELAAACGYSPWDDPWTTWEFKTGRAAPKKQTGPMRRGNDLEGTILKLHKRETGVKITDRQLEVRHPELDFIIGHADGVIPEAPGMDGPGIAEVKAPGQRSYDSIRDTGLSPDYIFQAHGLSECAGLKWARWIIYDYENHKTTHWDVPYSQQFMADAKPQLVKFWEHVQQDTPPGDDFVVPIEIPVAKGELEILLGEKWDDLGRSILAKYEAYNLGNKEWDEVKAEMSGFIEQQEWSKVQLGEFIKLVLTVPKNPKRYWKGAKLADWVAQLCAAIRAGDNEKAAKLAAGYRPVRFYSESVSRSFRAYPLGEGKF